MANKITVKFEAQGSRALKTAIDQLYLSQVRLEKGTKEYTRALAKLNKETGKNNKVTPLSVRNNRLLGNTFATLRSKMLLGAFAMTLVNKTLGAMTRAQGEQELAERKLEQALGFTSTALTNQASALQQVTAFGDEAIISAQALLGAFIKDEEQLKKATEATLDLAAAKGMDLNSAADLVGKTLGSSTNSLSRYGIEVEGAVGSTKRLDTLTNNIAKTFGGQAKAQAETLSGALQQMNNAIGDAAESIGNLLAPIVIDIAGFFKRAAESVSAFFGQLSESTLDTTIKQLEQMGEKVDDLKISQAERNVAMLELDVSGLESEERITWRIKELNQGIVSDLRFKARKSEELLGAKVSEAQLEREIEDAIKDQNFAVANNLKNSQKQLKVIQDRIDKDQASVDNLLEQDKKHKELAVAKRQLQNLLDRQNKSEENLNQNLKEGVEFHHDMLRTAKGRNDAAIVLLSTEEKHEIMTANRIVALMKEREIIRQQNEKLKKDTAISIRQTSAQIQAELELSAAKGEITEFERERLSIERELSESKANRLIGVTSEVERITEEIRAKTRLMNLEKQIKKERVSQITEQLSLGAKVAQQLAKEEKTKKAIAFAEAMVNVVSAGVSTFKKSSEVFLPPTPAILAASQVTLGTAMAAQILKYEQGGLVGGRRHSAGGTIIEAERGEFVMSRNAVESIGVDNLERLNTGGAAININITGNVMSADFVEGELAEKIQEAVRKGVDFGVS